jgi:hypothetical protein
MRSEGGQSEQGDDENTILLPSGDQAGREFPPAAAMIRSPVPSAFAMPIALSG